MAQTTRAQLVAADSRVAALESQVQALLGAAATATEVVNARGDTIATRLQDIPNRVQEVAGHGVHHGAAVALAMVQSLSGNDLWTLHPIFLEGEAREEFEDLVDDLGVASGVSGERTSSRRSSTSSAQCTRSQSTRRTSSRRSSTSSAQCTRSQSTRCTSSLPSVGPSSQIPLDNEEKDKDKEDEGNDKFGRTGFQHPTNVINVIFGGDKGILSKCTQNLI
ncbi:hypothetical protein C2845_PM11G04390 [Panicum miliaceum]|uniref:Uncharacterized protein n=1 Tax=Panicum miliaceum TaxID=4540 RepID=A0A3L6RNM0_PANMI|nr:hypothetical protein C2845_PM11G04390 [Panicum miliaceum]